MAQRDPINNFCRRFGHQTTVVDRRLYIDGGLVNWNPMQSYPANYSNTYLLYQDLDHDSSDGMPQLYANLSKNSSIPDVSGGVLWGDSVNKMFYLFGGEYYQEPPPATNFLLYAYDILNNLWVSLGPPQQVAISAVSYGAGTAVSERGEGYYYGGWLSNNTVAGWTGPAVATTGLVKYEMDTNSWTNSSGPDDVRRAEGILVYLPAGDGGLLVYFGGIRDPYRNGTVEGQSLDTIFIYDVLSSKWYEQTASGAIPGDRRRFCAGATWAPDHSSYNIYLYGGASMPPDTSGYDDVYVLSIPSFTWIKLYPTDGNYTGQYPHHSMACNVISGAQMLIIGGTFPLSDDCDVPQQWGTHNADLTEPNDVLWQLFDTNTTTPYSVPDPIVSAIGGGPSGGATKTAPASGWNNTDLPILITRTATVAARSPTRSIPAGDGEGKSGQGSSSLSKGAIAGIAVGAAAAVCLALACCWGMARRYRARQKRQPPPPNGVEGPPPEYAAGPPHQPYPAGGSPPHQPHMMMMTQGGGYGPASPAGLASGGGGSAQYYPWPPGMSPHPGGGGAPSPVSAYPAGMYGAASPPPIPIELAAGEGGGTGTNASSVPGGVIGTPCEAAKMDDQGRAWSPQVSEVQMSSPQRAHMPGSPGGGEGSPGADDGAMAGSRSPVHHGIQELSADTRP